MGSTDIEAQLNFEVFRVIFANVSVSSVLVGVVPDSVQTGEDGFFHVVEVLGEDG